MNTEVSDPQSIVSLSSNQVMLAAGNYVIVAWAPGHEVGSHALRWQNVTAGTTAAQGGNIISNAADANEQDNALLAGYFTANGTDAYELQHRSSGTFATSGFGSAGSYGTEVYATVLLIKLDD